MKIAIYDLDKTITHRPTFTHFLLFYARHECPQRLAALPVWIAALIGYRLGLYPRKPLKQFGIAMFMGRQIAAQNLDRVGAKFVDEVVIPDLQPGAARAIDRDRASGHRLLIATAAPEFYAKIIGARLDFDDVIATRHIIMPGGMISNKIDGENCYGPEKLRRIEGWMSEQGIKRDQAHIRFYSDHISDKPTLDMADEGFAINPDLKFDELATQSGWTVVNFAEPPDNEAVD